MSVGTDLILDPDDLETSFAPGRNFANKLWNAGRFILSNLEGPPRPLAGRAANVVRREELTLADRWIIARCDATVREATESYERFRLNEAAAAVYRFIWSDLADWYIEQIKPRLYGDAPGGDVARAVAAQTFDVALRLLHPVMPFVTEALWRRFPGRPADASISVAPWPLPDRARGGCRGAARVRAGPGAGQRHPRHPRRVRRAAGPGGARGREPAGFGRRRARSRAPDGDPPRQALRPFLRRAAERVGGHAVLSDGTAVFVPLGDAIDIGRECERLGGEMERLTQLVESQEKKLGNEQFVSRAPAEVVQREREKLTTWREQREVLSRKRELLGCGT